MPIVEAPWTKEQFEILPRQQIVEVIRSLDPREIVEKAYAGYIQGMKTGFAAVNLLTGKLETESLGQGERNQGQDALWVAIYKIDQNGIEWPDEDIFSEEEIEEYEKSNHYEDGYNIYEYFDLDADELEERELEALIHYFEIDWYWIEEQLNRWYVGESFPHSPPL